jgi:PAS domain S-box-containing protein
MSLLGRWPDLRLRAKGLFVVAFPAAATIVIACASYVIGNRAAEAERGVDRSLRTGQAIQRLMSNEIEASAHTRGYFITGEEEFADRARESLVAFDVTRLELADLTGDNPTQGRRLEQIVAIERSRVVRVIRGMTRFQWGALPLGEMRSVLKAAEAERLRMETLLNAMQDEEKNILERRSLRVDALRTDLRAITAICMFLGLTGGVLMSILFASGITNRIGKLQENVARLATGGVLDMLPGGRDEIGALSLGIAKTAEIVRCRTAALENASHGIAEANVAGRYLNFNRAYGLKTGLRDLASAPSVLDTVHPEDRNRLEEALGRMGESGRAEIESRILHPDGRVVHVDVILVHVPEQREGGYFVFMRDVTRRKEAEAALVQAKDAAVAGSLAKSTFLAKISHDIRTPLNAILGAADLLSQSPLHSDQAEYVGMFQRNCRRLIALINDFLDFSKIEAGAVRVENIPYQVRETVEEAVAPFRDLASRKGVTLRAEIGPDVPEWELGDPLRVHQVLVNLLSNAIKFVQRGHVDVRIQRIALPERDHLRFEVSDTGPGIRTEDQQRIFGEFAQSGKPDFSARSGCGLGLAICRDLVGLMGGEIGVTSQEGCGSTFFFTLPLIATRPGVAPDTSGPVPESLRLEPRDAFRVLAAEDTEDNRLLMELYLRGEQVDLQFAENGQQAVDAVCRGEEFDLILMDMDMPVLDGIGAVKAIRAWQSEHTAAHTPIVGVSAHAMREAVRACLDAGCAAHVAKPYDQATLLGAIRRYARQARRTEAASSGVAEQVAALVPKYLASKWEQLGSARASLAANDFEPARRFGHNLKGTGSGYGFPRIEEIGAEMEQAALDCDGRAVSIQLAALHQLLTDDPRAGAAKAPERLIIAEQERQAV